MPPRAVSQNQSKAGGARLERVVRDAEGMLLRMITAGGGGSQGRRALQAKGAAGSKGLRQGGARQV